MSDTSFVSTGEIIVCCIMIIVIVTGLTIAIFDSLTDCNYELWTNEDWSRQGSQLHLLIESKVDSLLVVDMKKPEPIGILYFKPYKQEE